MTSPTDQITTAVDRVRSLVAAKAMASVVGWCTTFNLQSANDFEGRRALHSPARQISFLLGLLLATHEPAGEEQLTKEEWKDVQELLNAAFGAYQLLYYPSKEEPTPSKEEWSRVREVAMPAFMHYVGSDVMASVEQVDARIQRYLVPFDAELGDLLGVTATAALAICQWLARHLQESLLALNAAADAEKAARLELLEQAEREKWSLAELREAAHRATYRPLAEEMLRRLDSLGCVYQAELREVFPDTADAFWRAFTIKRGAGSPLAYPTEQTDYDLHPLILRDAESAFCPSVNALFGALLLSGELALTKGAIAARYHRSRDKALESEGLELFRRYFGAYADIYGGLFERPDRQFEHDLVVLAGDRCLVVEAKAAPPIEPFRDPERAFTRLRHAFRADTGIQSAFEQANRVLRRLSDGETVDLYDGNGNLAVRLDPAVLRASYAVCLTRDDHGPLATNLNLLLEKDGLDPYPWVVNAFDFTAICEAREYWEWHPAVLFEYLDERLGLHGKAFTTDELDLFAFRLRHGTLNWIRDSQADLFVVDPHYADLFDEMYRTRAVGDPKIELRPAPPVLTDLRRSLAQGQLVTVTPTASAGYPRNRDCPCGSGRKYKNCCGSARRRH